MVFVFLGKGGVGKTTMACSLAWSLSEKDIPVYIFSIDPAHNLYHFFGMESEKTVTELKRGLFVEEIDIDEYIRRLLSETTERMKDQYRYLQILNLEGMFDILKHSPGIQEWAMLSAINERLDRFSSKVKHILIDSPPTGLAIRLLSLSITGTIWIEKLIQMRKRILQKRDEIIRIRGTQEGPPFYHEQDKDPVTAILREEYGQLSRLTQLLMDPRKAKLVLVLNYDELSMQEGLGIIKDLSDLGMTVSATIINKENMIAKKTARLQNLLKKFSVTPLVEIPFFKESLQIEEIGNILMGALIDEH